MQSSPGAGTLHHQGLGSRSWALASQGHQGPGKEGCQSLTGPDQSRYADWWSPHGSGTTVGAQAAEDPSTEAQHPEDKKQEPRIHPPLPCLQDIPASLQGYKHSFSWVDVFPYAHLPTQQTTSPLLPSTHLFWNLRI